MKGHILKNLRKQAKLTQKELAEKIGIAQNTIAMIETNKRSGDKETLNKIADFFNVSLDFLEGREINDLNEDKSSLIDKFLDDLIESGVIKDPDNIDDKTAKMIINAIKAEVALKMKKKNM